MVEFLTKKLKNIVGIDDIELDIIAADGEDLPGEKLKTTEETLDRFDETIDRLYCMVSSLDIPVVEEQQECEVDKPRDKDSNDEIGTFDSEEMANEENHVNQDEPSDVEEI